MYPAQKLLQAPDRLADHLARVLNRNGLEHPFLEDHPVDMDSASAVLVLLGRPPAGSAHTAGPCLILNKRSENVRQPGDLCYPGGSLMSRTDRFLARLIRLPLMPLGRWRYWSRWKRQNPYEARMIALLLATCLRESVEEMRLNPFGVRFLGPLSPYRLRLFQRKIYPMMGWMPGRQRFTTNWEVDRIVHLPLRDLMDEGNFYRYRLEMGHTATGATSEKVRELPCYRHTSAAGDETLWGATYHITMQVLRLAFEFKPPALEKLPVLEGRLGSNYLTGNSL